MCRQSCPSEFISYRESDAPRGRAILLHSVYQGGKEFDSSTVQAIYNCFLCGACKSWCSGQELGGYDIPELIKFARRDIVSQGLAPQAVKQMKDSLVANDNTANQDKKSSYTASVTEHTAETLYLLGEGVNYTNPEIAEAFIRILENCQIYYTLLKDEPTSGKELDLLGYREEAREKAKSMAGRIKATGCKTIVVSDPLVYDALKNDYPEWGISLKGEVLHVSEYLLKLVCSGKLKLKPTSDKVTLADSEFLGRNNGIYEAPREVIRASAGEHFAEMQWNHEYLQSAGEAAFTFDGILFDRGKELGRKISQKAEDIGAEIIVTLSATAKNNISATTGLKVMDIAEFAAIQMV
ncbi:MAG: hypothetical protein A2W89_09365 [Bacteroidetes bacterium GWE2_42_39]|nr:MAG: hypothetical protein A2W92_22135 [Bacteroidetes bacterium GWA2_42_15]OFX98123.1 MAG: hypothetical protein A2W89_09365 [Bacteroidetes bacterium GWE2_42_39]